MPVREIICCFRVTGNERRIIAPAGYFLHKFGVNRPDTIAGVDNGVIDKPAESIVHHF